MEVLNQSLIEEPKDSLDYGELTLTIDSLTRTILDLLEDYCWGGFLFAVSLDWGGDLRSSGSILGEDGELFEMLDHCLLYYNLVFEGECWGFLGVTSCCYGSF